MGLRKLDLENWLTVDSTYHEFHQVRRQLLKERKNEVIQCLPGSRLACEEVLDLVVGFLTTKYPDLFETTAGYNTLKPPEFIRNKITGEECLLLGNATLPPLEIAARVAMEDFNVLMRNEETGEHHL